MKYSEFDNPIYTISEIQGRISEFGGTIGLPCFIGLIYGMVRLFRYSISDWQGWIFLIGAILSWLGTITYGVTILEKKEKSWRLMIFSFLGFFPYLFGCFFVFYKGFWSFRYLFNSFSFAGLIVPIIWIVLGYRIVNQLYLLTEFGKAINEGRIKIEPNKK